MLNFYVLLSTELSLLRKSPRKSIAVVPYGRPNQNKEDNCTSFDRTKSPLRSLSQSPFKSPQKPSVMSPKTSSFHTPVDNGAKENCLPSRNKSARKLQFNSGVSSVSTAKANCNDHPTKEPSIDIMSVMNVVNEVYGTSQGLGKATDSGEELPLHQKLAVCSLLLIRRDGKSKDITVGKVCL